MTYRLSKYMGKIFPQEQNCVVKDWQLSDIIWNLANYKDDMEAGYFIMLDLTKAFDRVNHQYMFKVLDHIGIKCDFFEISKTIYKNISSQITVTVNRGSTEKIVIKRGVRQGCPYSMMLFVISTKPLILMINGENKITGYTTKWNNTITIQSHADDNTIIMKKNAGIKQQTFPLMMNCNIGLQYVSVIFIFLLATMEQNVMDDPVPVEINWEITVQVTLHTNIIQS